VADGPEWLRRWPLSPPIRGTPGGNVLAKLRARNKKAFAEDVRRIGAAPHRRKAPACPAP